MPMLASLQGIYELEQERVLEVYKDILEQAHKLIWRSKEQWSKDSVRALAGE